MNKRHLYIVLSITLMSALSAPMIFAKNEDQRLLSPPVLIVDLDGDGFETIPLEESNAYFDMDGDGLVERTEWVAPDDGIFLSSTLLQTKWPVYTRLTKDSHKIFNFLERIKKHTYQQGENAPFYIGVEPDKPITSRFMGPRMSINQDKNSDGMFDNRRIYGGVVCDGRRLMYDTKGNMTLDCKDGTRYSVKEVRFEYEDSNLKWDAHCETIGFRTFAGFLGRIGGENYERNEYDFLLMYADVIMCLDQGFEPNIPAEYLAEDRRAPMDLYLMQLKEYKRGMFSDRVK